MNEALASFLLQVPDLDTQQPAAILEYFVYFLTVIQKEDAATPAGIERCFELSRLQKYSNISAYLSRHSKRGAGTHPKFIKVKGGYHLERNRELELQKTLNTGPARQETSHLLRGLLTKLSSAQEKSFLQEAIDCYEIGARRAAITLVWILTVHHLAEYILKHEAAAFNATLAKNTDKRIRITSAKKIDDFSEIPESKLIELARAAQIISNDVRKILDAKLGIRNSSAHPSGVTISEVKATDFVMDLVENVLIKYVV
jgi:hypothetical protein